MLEGVLAPGGTASEVSIPGYQLAGQDGHGEQDRPGDRRILETPPTWPRSSASRPAADPKLLCAVVVDEPQTGSIFGGTGRRARRSARS